MLKEISTQGEHTDTDIEYRSNQVTQGVKYFCYILKFQKNCLVAEYKEV